MKRGRQSLWGFPKPEITWIGLLATSAQAANKIRLNVLNFYPFIQINHFYVLIVINQLG